VMRWSCSFSICSAFHVSSDSFFHNFGTPGIAQSTATAFATVAIYRLEIGDLKRLALLHLRHAESQRDDDKVIVFRVRNVSTTPACGPEHVGKGFSGVSEASDVLICGADFLETFGIPCRLVGMELDR
jgi:hypothetical protein